MATLLVSHVLISLVAIVAGFLVSYAFLRGKRHEKWTLAFLVTTIATSASGFLFPADHVTPAHVFGVLSLIALAVAVASRNDDRNVGAWSGTHIVTTLFAFYLNAFVLVAQSFQKIPALKELAPTQSEQPFAVAQLGLLVGFLVMGYWALRRNHVLQVRGIHRILQLVKNWEKEGAGLTAN